MYLSLSPRDFIVLDRADVSRSPNDERLKDKVLINAFQFALLAPIVARLRIL